MIAPLVTPELLFIAVQHDTPALLDSYLRWWSGDRPAAELYDAQDRMLATAAAELGHTEILRTLRKNRFALDTADQRGWTPAHAAGLTGQAEVIDTLRELGAHLASTGAFWCQRRGYP